MAEFAYKEEEVITPKKKRDIAQAIEKVARGEELTVAVRFATTKEADEYAWNLATMFSDNKLLSSAIEERYIGFVVRENEIIFYPSEKLSYHCIDFLDHLVGITDEGLKAVSDAMKNDETFGILKLKGKAAGHVYTESEETIKFLTEKGFAFKRIGDLPIYEIMAWPYTPHEEVEKMMEAQQFKVEKKEEEQKKPVPLSLEDIKRKAKEIMEDETKDADLAREVAQSIFDALNNSDAYLNSLSDYEERIRRSLSEVETRKKETWEEIKSRLLKPLALYLNIDTIKSISDVEQKLKNALMDLEWRRRGFEKGRELNLETYVESLKLCEQYIDMVKKLNEAEQEIKRLNRDIEMAKKFRPKEVSELQKAKKTKEKEKSELIDQLSTQGKSLQNIKKEIGNTLLSFGIEKKELENALKRSKSIQNLVKQMTSKGWLATFSESIQLSKNDEELINILLQKDKKVAIKMQDDVDYVYEYQGITLHFVKQGEKLTVYGEKKPNN